MRKPKLLILPILILVLWAGDASGLDFSLGDFGIHTRFSVGLWPTFAPGKNDRSRDLGLTVEIYDVRYGSSKDVIIHGRIWNNGPVTCNSVSISFAIDSYGGNDTSRAYAVTTPGDIHPGGMGGFTARTKLTGVKPKRALYTVTAAPASGPPVYFSE